MYDSNTYLVFLDNEQYGPYDLLTMREMMLMTDTMVKKLPDGVFMPASSYPELKEYLMVEEPQHTQQPQQSQEGSYANFDLDRASFYYRDKGDMFGPYSIWELSILDITENSELSIDNMVSWTTAKNIPGLIETIQQISGADEIGRILKGLEKISLDKDELERVIKDQEKDLVNKQREITELQKEIERLKEDLLKKRMIDEKNEHPTFDLSSDYRRRYISFAEKLDRAFSSLRDLLPQRERYVRVFQSHEDEVEYHLNAYRHSMDRIGDIFTLIKGIMSDASEVYNEDIQLIDGSLSKLQYDIINQLDIEINAVVGETQKQIRELENVRVSSKDYLMGTLSRELDNKKTEITRRSRKGF